jgi:hypothetical protein
LEIILSSKINFKSSQKEISTSQKYNNDELNYSSLEVESPEI